MIYPSADRLSEQVESRYTLVVLAAKRAKQLRDGAPKLIETTSTNPLTIALEEIAAGKVSPLVADHDRLPPKNVEPELEAIAGMETAQEEAAELVAEAPVVDEAARVAELLKVPGSEEEAEEEESLEASSTEEAESAESSEDQEEE